MSELVWSVLESQEDSSVNFVAETEDGGKIETRFVQRSPEYFIVYLSSHTGCNKSCRMCHLTATGQTYFTPVTPDQYLQQAHQVFKHWDLIEPGIRRSDFGEYANILDIPTREDKHVHFNFMARGEPLANDFMLRDVSFTDESSIATIFLPLQLLASEYFLFPKIKISTIMPTEVEDIDLHDLTYGTAQFYYSLYSVSDKFRKRWLPKSLPVHIALEKLKAYQNVPDDGDTAGTVIDPVVFHWAFIEGENDSTEDVEATIKAIEDSGVTGKFNLVRYNPPNNKSKESSPEVLQRNFDIINDAFRHPGSKIIPRVGFDVKASCGMFV